MAADLTSSSHTFGISEAEQFRAVLPYVDSHGHMLRVSVLFEGYRRGSSKCTDLIADAAAFVLEFLGRVTGCEEGRLGGTDIPLRRPGVGFTGAGWASERTDPVDRGRIATVGNPLDGHLVGGDACLLVRLLTVRVALLPSANQVWDLRSLLRRLRVGSTACGASCSAASRQGKNGNESKR